MEPPPSAIHAMKGARLNPEMANNKQVTRSLCFKTDLGRTPQRKKGPMLSRRMRGFSMIEMMIVLALILVVTAFSVMTIRPSLLQNDLTEGFNQTLMALRQARDTSVAQRQIYFVTFNNAAIPNTITITQGSTGNVTSTYSLPTDVSYVALAGIPISPVVFPTTPDGFGVGATAIDFDQGVAGGVKNVIYFYPDGSAEDVNGNVNNGVVYLALLGNAGYFKSSRAITLWGATGRVRAWRLESNAGAYYWRQQ
jgi:prepilin-type N-terminal cleavage/methylation domain-containing protein